MAGAITPGLLLSPRVRIRRARRLPVAGEVLVQAGALVGMDDVVARAFVAEAPVPVRAAAVLGVPPKELATHLKVSEGEAVGRGQLLAERRASFGLFAGRVVAPADGTVESVSRVTGMIMIRPAPSALLLKAYLPGTVVAILDRFGVEIEAEVTAVQGIFGLGGEATGVLRRVADRCGDRVDADRIRDEHQGAVLLGGGAVTLAALEKLRAVGAIGIVTGSASGAGLLKLAGPGLNPAATGDEQLGLTLVLTEGLGDIGMAPARFDLLSGLEGQKVAVNGATQVRAGVIRPELIAAPGEAAVPRTGQAAESGERVRIVRGPAFGQTGRIIAAPSSPELLPSGVRALVFEILLDDNRRIRVPRPNVEPVY